MKYKYYKTTDRYWAVFYCFLALGLLCWGLYSKEYIFLLGAFIVGLVDYYWIAKAWKSAKG